MKTTLILLLAGLLATALYCGYRVTPAPGPGAGKDPLGPALPPGDDGGGGSKGGGQDLARELARGREREQEQEREQEPQRATLRTARIVTLTGRCLDAGSRRPLPGSTVVLTVSPGGELLAQRPGTPPRQAPPVLADQEGRFHAHIEQPAGYYLEVLVRHPGRADLHGMPSSPAAEIGLGDLLLPAGVRLEARLVDERGRGLEGVELGMTTAAPASPADGAAAGGLRPRRQVFLRSGPDGLLTDPPGLLPGRWHLALDPLHELVGPGQLVLELPAESHRIDVVVRPPAPDERIGGRVSDPDGRPVAGAAVQAAGSGGWPLGQATTGADGSFHLKRRRGSPADAVRLLIPAARGFEPHASAPVAWGAEGIRLVLEPAQGFALEVLAAPALEPVPRFRVLWFQDHAGAASGSWQQGLTPSLGPTGGRQTTVPGVPRGNTSILVLPAGQALAPSAPVALQPGTVPRIVLEPRVPFVVQVVDDGGNPVAGSRVELLAAIGAGSVQIGARAFPYEDYPTAARTTHAVLALATGTTAADGTAGLSWRRGAAGLALRVTGSQHLAVLVPDLRFDGGRVLVEVSGGARLEGTVRPTDVLAALAGRGPEGACLALRHLDPARAPDGRLLQPVRRRHRLDASGRFAIGGLEPGRWEISLGWADVGAVLLETVRLGQGEQRHLDFDIGDQRPARLRGRVFLDGLPQRHARIELVRLAAPGRAAGAPIEGPADQVPLPCDGAGAFDAPGLRPGVYRLGLEVGFGAAAGGDRVHQLVATAAIHLGAGADTTQDFHLQRAALQLQIVDDQGRALGRRHFVVRRAEVDFKTMAETDAQGHLRIDPIAAGRYEICDWRPGGPPPTERWGGSEAPLRVLGEIEAQPGGAEQRFRVDDR